MSALLGALGGVAMLFALASFFMAYAGVAHPSWSILHGVIGIALLGSAAAVNLDALRERMRSGEIHRASRFGSSALLSTLLAISILAMGAFLANRYPQRFDWSEQKVHSLSDQTQKLLDGLDQEVTAVALYGRLDWRPVRDLLDRYDYASERFRVDEIADPNEKPDLLVRLEVTPEQLGEGIIRLAYGGESVHVTELTEEALTNAIVKLTRRGEKVVYFLEGHNERLIEGDAGKDREGYAMAADALRNENYRVEKLLLAVTGDVPEAANAVIVAGPTRPLLAEESAALDRYLQRGGAVLAMIDPRARTNLVEKLAEWGVVLGDDLVVDRQQAIFGQANTPVARHDPNHAITRDLREYSLFHVVRSVKQSEGATGSFTEIVHTGRDSWAERDLEKFFTDGEAELNEDDLIGPVPIGIAGTVKIGGTEGESEESRLVVFGDADFASNQLLDFYQNRDLFVNTVNWLLGDVELISVRPNQSRASRFQLTASQANTIRLFSLFALPEALAVVGVFIWWTRRQTDRR
jgi:ABC-type uncharacterized transport system involved in gliding motility auxiliary subunit